MKNQPTNKKHSPNRLLHETSPYLLQHAYNPVDWYPWGDEALQKAKEENKPILLSIGYAACHWCHVMEHESFENEQVAAYMNEHFVNIKVDREERPDIDQIYMDVVTALTGAGGWPLNCFLTPDALPFYGGTYFPPQPMYNRPSWPQILQWIIKLYQSERTKVEEQAQQLTYHTATHDKNFFASSVIVVDYSEAVEQTSIDELFNKLHPHFDTEDGGFGGAPKFPNTQSIAFLLRYHYLTGNETAAQHAFLSLDKMIDGGIFDHIGGGFARYTVDKKWLVPHFEKMLYDNALLVQLLAEAYQLTGNERYKETIEQTLVFIDRDMSSPEGGFYSSYDADSEGEEGKFYVWDKSEVAQILGEEAALFCQFYDITEQGNWEHKNILQRLEKLDTFAQKNNLSVDELNDFLAKSKQKLFAVREQRIKPGLDDKIILSWNVLMISAYAKAYEALGTEAYKQRAEQALTFLLEKFKTEEGIDVFSLHHTYKADKAKFPAFLDDYAFLIEALLNVYQINFQPNLLDLAESYTEHVLNYFKDPEQPSFYYTAIGQKDVIVRKKEFYDSATPSGNATMGHNLLHLGLILDKETYTKQAVELFKSMEESVKKHPTFFARWANGLLRLAYPPYEIAIIGAEMEKMAQEVNKLFLPHKVLMGSESSTEQYPLLTERFEEGKTLLYVCQNYACQMPVETVAEAKMLLGFETNNEM